MIPALMGRKKAVTTILGAFGKEEKAPEEDGDTLTMAMEDLVSAVGSKDAKAAALAFRTAFNCLESEEDKEEDMEG
jgi:hypothetical protein